MLDRRRILAGLGTIAATGLVPEALLAAASIKVDDTSALLVIDVQNCFLPGGSLAVKEGDQVVPVINRIAKSFANVQAVTPGFDSARVLSARLTLPAKRFNSRDAIVMFQRALARHRPQRVVGRNLLHGTLIPAFNWHS